MNLEGYLDSCDATLMRGWIRDLDQPARRLSLKLYLNGTLLARAKADQYRGDLLEAGKGDGKYAFRIVFSKKLSPTEIAALALRIPGTNQYFLPGRKTLEFGPVEPLYMKVYLHTGAGKTGTSAIQVALAAMRPQLAAAGIVYPDGFNGSDAKAEHGQITSGNGGILGGLLNTNQRRPNFDKNAVMAWLRTCIDQAGGNDLLFSSELMQTPRDGGVAELCAFFDTAGYEVTVIFYVRHALDQAVAAYLQGSKRGMTVGGDTGGGETGGRETGNLSARASFLRREKTAYLAGLEPFAKILPPERIIVRLYDKERDDLVPGFLRLLRDTPFTVPAAASLINRSPTAAEHVMFEELSRVPDGARLCILVADLTVNQPSSVPVVASVTAAEFTEFSARNQTIVDEVNTRFLKGNGTLLIKSDKLVVGDIPPPPVEEVYVAFARTIALLDSHYRARLRRELEAVKARRQGIKGKP